MSTGVIVAGQLLHRIARTYRHKVHAFIALTEFARRLMVRGGLPEGRVFVKPNFVPDPRAAGNPAWPRKRQFAFVGRIMPEKGLDLLLDAWVALANDKWRLVIAGDGPERARLEREYQGISGVEWCGWVDSAQVSRTLAESMFLVLPSRWYEGLPMVVLEAMATGTPTLVADIGGLGEVVQQDQSGFLFAPGSKRSVVETLRRAIATEGSRWRALSRGARDRYLSRYTREQNYRQLMTIYDHAARIAGIEDFSRVGP